MDKCNVLVVPPLVPAAASHTVLATGLTSGASDSAAITIRKACEATAVSTAAGSPAGVAGYANDDASTPAVDETLFNDPWRVAFRLDQSGQLLVADKSNFVVRTVAIDGSLPRSALLSGIPGQRGLADGFNDKPGPKFAELVGLGQIVAEPTGNGTYNLVNTFVADQGNNCARGFIDASYAGYDLVSRCALNWSRDPGYPGSLRGVNDVYGFGGDGFPAYFNGVFGAVDHAGCVEELIFSDGVERKLVCRPAGSSVSLDAVALSPDAATLYTNNWLQAGASSSTDGVMMVPIHDDPTKTPHRCANWTGTPGCPAAAPTVLVSDYRGTPIHADGIAATEQAVYVVDSKANALYRIANGSAQRLAGGNAAAAAFTDGQGCQATLNAPHGVAALELGTTTLLFVADTGNQRIRKLVLTR